jgi:iron complex transport system ATP-binding protein
MPDIVGMPSNQGIARPSLRAEALGVPGRLAPATLSLQPGTLAALVGPNGAGKSTLLAALAGLVPAQGRAFLGSDSADSIDALSPPERARRLAWVGQEARFDFAFTVREVVAQGRFAWGDDSRGIDDALAELDLVSLAARPVTQLSGGERHRVTLARARATGAPVQLWDEPVAQLDVRHALEVLALARRLASAGGTLVLSLHDLPLALRFDQVLVLSRGQLVAQGKPQDVLTPQLIREVFGVRAVSGPALLLELE